MTPQILSHCTRKLAAGKTGCREAYLRDIFVHPSAPLVKVLENVPRGHGNSIAI